MNNGRAGHHIRGRPSRRRLRVAAIRQELTNGFFRIPDEFICDSSKSRARPMRCLLMAATG
jgi:hypothetical protein